MQMITTDSLTFEVPAGGEHFTDGDRLVWRDGRHELIVNVTSASAELLSHVEAIAHTAIEQTLIGEQLQVLGRVEREPTASVPCSFVTATLPDQSGLFTQGVIRGSGAVMFATLESLSFDPDHVALWSGFVRSVRNTPPN